MLLSFLKLPKVFYGWWIVIASLFTGLYVGGVVFYGFTAIFEPIANEMGWSYAQVSFAASLRGLEMGILAPLIGILTDLWGPRKIILIGAIVTGVGLFLLGYVTSLVTFYGVFALISIGMSGCTMTVLMTAVANWFHKKVGLATGLAVSGFGFGGLLVPVMVKLIEVYEWRMAVSILAFGMFLTIIPLSFVFRHKPEQYGYLTDGQKEDQVIPANETGTSHNIEVDIKINRALKSSTFWQISLSFMFHVMLVNATVTHVMPYLSSIGISRSVSSLVATGIPLTSIIGRLGLGWLGDKRNKKQVTAGAFIMMGSGLFCFALATTAGAWILVPFIILFGIGYGGANSLRPSLVREYFGRTSFGTVFGSIIGASMIGSIIGPVLAGWAYDNWGSYQGIWFIFVSTTIIAVISTLTIHSVGPTVKSVDKV
ncbi:MFS transporter [Chloroflexota bacterium]